MLNPGLHPLRDGRPPAFATAWGEDRFGVYVGFMLGGVGHCLRWVPPGRFLIGSPETEVGRYGDEVQHEVELREGFWLGETPVTQALWEAVLGQNPSHFRGADRPVEQVSFADCQAFLQRLDQLVPGLGPRLPTEAEWERACRAGTTTVTSLGDLRRGEEAERAAVLERIAWYDKTSGGETHPVGQKEPNPLGIFDMLGNVWEWCQDWEGPYQRGLQVDPAGPPAGSIRVVRGGSWINPARFVRAAFRSARVPVIRNADLGFRLAGGQGSVPGRPAEPRSGSLKSGTRDVTRGRR